MAISKQNANTLRAVQRLGEGAQSRAGLGVDIIEIGRMEKILGRTPRFVQRVFSPGEREYASAKARPATHYALFFAAKEAVLKALGSGFAGIGYTDVEVTHDRRGRPVPLLHGRAAELANEQGIVEVELSLSYTHQVGVASAVAIKSEDRPRKDERKDPMEDLRQQFKELRSMLDNMDERIQELRGASDVPGAVSGDVEDAATDEVSGGEHGAAGDEAVGEAADAAQSVATGDVSGGERGEAADAAQSVATGDVSGGAGQQLPGQGAAPDIAHDDNDGI
jgi:holo-[acyl-carrier protein] synthase